MVSTNALAQLGVLQGIFLFIAILSRGWHKTGNITLGALALIIAVRLLPEVFTWIPANLSNSIYQCFFNALIFLFGPLLWLYVRNLTGIHPSRETLKHVIPFVIVLLAGLVTPRYARQTILNITGMLIYPHIIIYQVGMLFELSQFTRAARDFVSNPEGVELLWFRLLLIGSIILLSGNIIADFAFLLERPPGWIAFLPFITSNLFLFGIAFLAIRHPEIDPEIHETKVQIAVGSLPAEHELRYKKNRLGKSTELKILSSLTKYLEINESFRNDELRLSDLASETGYASNTISMVLNIHQRENFYQFVNRYRVEFAKKALSNTNRSTESILEIAFDSGFRSKSTFNTVFRGITGRTPSQFRSG